MQTLDFAMDLLNSCEGNLVTTKSKAKVIWCTHEDVLDLRGNFIVDIVQAQIKVLELRAAE